MLGGGGGSIQHMITTLRNNRELLRRRTKFKHKKDLSEIVEAYSKHVGRKTELIHKEASPEILEQIRKDCKKTKQRETIIYATVGFLVFAALVYFSYIIVTEDNKIYRTNLEKEQQRLEQKRMNDFNIIMQEGREYIKDNRWQWAIICFEEALSIYPDNFEANHGLAQSYALFCQEQGIKCQTAEKKLDELLARFPEKTKAYELRAYYCLHMQDTAAAYKDFKRIDELSGLTDGVD